MNANAIQGLVKLQIPIRGFAIIKNLELFRNAGSILHVFMFLTIIPKSIFKDVRP